MSTPNNKVEAPASAKTSSVDTSKQTNVAGAGNKTNESGSVKSPQTGSTLSANQSETKAASMAANTPTTKAVAESARTANNQQSEKLDSGISELKGEVLQGDSFRITLKRGNKTLLIPVPITGSDNVVILDNTFRIISEVMKASTEKELSDKFASFVQ